MTPTRSASEGVRSPGPAVGERHSHIVIVPHATQFRQDESDRFSISCFETRPEIRSERLHLGVRFVDIDDQRAVLGLECDDEASQEDQGPENAAANQHELFAVAEPVAGGKRSSM